MGILEKALSYADKRQWYGGESVYLTEKGADPAVWLQNTPNGTVDLYVSRGKSHLTVFFLDFGKDGKWHWVLAKDIELGFSQWLKSNNVTLESLATAS